MTTPATLLLVLMIATSQLKAAAIPMDHGSVVTSTAKGEKDRELDHGTLDSRREKGRSIYRKRKGPAFPVHAGSALDAGTIWLADGSFFPLQFEKTTRDAQGQTLL
jgi:hypothetical protein